MERALIQQINGAIDHKFLQALRSPATGRINKTIPDIFEYLFTNFGNVSPDELSELKDEAQKMAFDVKEPVDTVFTTVDNIADIAKIAKSPLTEQQKIDMGYIILKKAKPFQSSLLKWDIKPATAKSWDNFKNFFRQVQVALHKTGGLTVQDGINHSELVNMVSEGVRQAMVERGPDLDEIAFNMQEENNMQQQLSEMKEMMEQLRQENVALQVAGTQNNRQPMQNLTNQQPFFNTPNPHYGTPQYNPGYQGYWYNQNINNNRGSGNGNGRWRRGNNNRNNNNNRWNKNRWNNNGDNRNNFNHNNNGDNRNNFNHNNNGDNRNNFNHYCWSHGLCSHPSAKCRTPMNGHQPNDTFENRMGGSARNICS